jgi:hypothetical protein
MYQKIKAELQIFFVLLVVTAVLLLWSTSLRLGDPQAAEMMQKLDETPIASFQNGSPTNPTALFEFINPLQVTAAYTYYLPSIRKFPSPTPLPYLFFDNFSDDDSGWVKFSNDDCEGGYTNGEYRLEVEEDSDGEDECFAFTSNEDAEHKYARFEVQFRRSDGTNHYNAGIYINGRGGGEYYLFRVEHDGNNCDWRLVRRKDSSSDTKISGSCDTRTNGGSATNTLLIAHTSDGVLKVYLNGQLLGSYTDGSQLTGEGTGLFVNSETVDDNVVVRFDNFAIYTP